MSRKVGIGIIGTGFARRVQVPAFLNCENARIVSIASGSIENAEVAAAEAGADHFTAKWQDTVAHREVELVCITTPPVLHKEMTLFAIENGKHILCEKPMAMDSAEAAEMTAAAAGKSLLALIDHELRFQPGRQRAFEMLRDGAIGKVRHAKAIFRAPQRGDASVPWNWWSDAASGGGALGAIGSHLIDSFRWLLGTEISSVSAQLQTHVKERGDHADVMRPVTTDDESNMLLRFAGGEIVSDATGLVSISMAEMPAYQNRLEIFGTAGAIRIGSLGELEIAKTGDNDWTPLEVGLGQRLNGMPDTGFARGFVEFALMIVNAIAHQTTSIDHAATFSDGLAVQRVLDAAKESDAAGIQINL